MSGGRAGHHNMNLLYKRLTVGFAIVGTAILAFGVACFAAGARINTTKRCY